MPLPDLIEIVPLDKPVRAEITVPGSKSITNRALVLAALAAGEITLTGALWSEDTQVMTDCLQDLGFMVNVEDDPEEFCNRTITVYGKSGRIPSGGTKDNPLELFVGNAGTAARFLAAMVCLGNGVYRLHGTPRMHERPQAALFQALRELGYRVESENNNDKLPAIIHGQSAEHRPVRRAKCRVSIEHSSQFASALLLSASMGGWDVEVVGENAEESPYVAMTSKLIEVFPKPCGTFQIEPDASSGSYFLAAGEIAESPFVLEYSKQFGIDVPTQTRNQVAVACWPKSDWQIDARFEEFLIHGGRMRAFKKFAEAYKTKDSPLDKKALIKSYWESSKSEVSRTSDLGDSIMLAIVITPLLEQTRFIDLGRLRVQECERVVALRTELTKCGAKVIEEGDTLTVYPSALHGAEIETYNDHRMAMCFAVLGLKIPGIKIKDPACVKKTFPNFFQKLAAPPPHGLGATILDAKSGRKLDLNELFAD